MRSHRFVVAVLGFCLLGLTSGCGDGSGRHAISGTVTLDGTPLQEGSISFQQQQGGASSGAVITNGTYSIPREKGLPIGTYRVMIFSSAGDEELPAGGMPGDEFAEDATSAEEMGAARSELIPAKYNLDSRITIEVGPEGPYEYSFPIKTKE